MWEKRNTKENILNKYVYLTNVLLIYLSNIFQTKKYNNN